MKRTLAQRPFRWQPDFLARPLDEQGGRRAILQAFTSEYRMNQSLLWSVGMVTLAGILQGIFAAPVKRLPAWRWQSHWLLFALSGLIIFP